MPLGTLLGMLMSILVINLSYFIPTHWFFIMLGVISFGCAAYYVQFASGADFRRRYRRGLFTTFGVLRTAFSHISMILSPFSASHSSITALDLLIGVGLGSVVTCLNETPTCHDSRKLSKSTTILTI